MRPDLNRIAVVGTTGSGMSTFSRRLSGALGLPHIELDALFWKQNWEQTTDEEFSSAVNSAVSQPRWIVDGNRSRARHIIWSRATTLIWLDYPLTRTFPRLLGGRFVEFGRRKRSSTGIARRSRRPFSAGSRFSSGLSRAVLVTPPT